MVRPRIRKDSGRRVNGVPATATPEVVYPESDGTPLAETQLTGAEMVRITETLQDYFAARPDVYVWMNMFIYYEEGNPTAVVAPDVFVAIGASKEPFRRTYRVWDEGLPPTVVLEVTSASTRANDVGPKRDIYARMGVAEYFLYDPHGEYLRPPLQGVRLVEGRYEPMAVDASARLVSEAMGLRLALFDGRLQFIDPLTGQRLLSREERAARADALAHRVAELERLLEERAQGPQND
jgi:Uma2 family endonuclease